MKQNKTHTIKAFYILVRVAHCYNIIIYNKIMKNFSVAVYQKKNTEQKKLFTGLKIPALL